MLQPHLFLFVLLAISFSSLAQTFLDFANVTVTEGVIEEKCSTNGGKLCFNNLKSTSSHLREKFVQDFNLLTILNETELYRKSFLREALLRYCGTRSQYKREIKKVLLAVRDCLNYNEKSMASLLYSITEEINGFVCYKDGARATMFVDEDGFECVSSKMEKMSMCISNIIVIEPQLTINRADYLNASKCIVKMLDECEDVTAANMMHALMKYIHTFTLNYTNIK